MNKIITTTCPYCGVGCGISAEVNEALRSVKISGDITHPANFGRLCSKGSALGETLTLAGRLLEPSVNGQQTSWDIALQKVADTFLDMINRYGQNSVAIYGSGQLLTEDYYVANKLMKGFIGNANIDTNSRLCMSSSVAGHKRAFGSDTVPGCYADFENADLFILIGSNTAWCHPVSYQRIRAAKENNARCKVVVIDPRRTSTCDIADLHLPIASGTDAILWNGLLHYLSSYQTDSKNSSQKTLLNIDYIKQYTEGFAEALTAASTSSHDIEQVAIQCQISVEAIRYFYQWFADTEKVMSLYSQGINQSASGTDKVNAIINCHLATGRLGQPGMGPFSLTGQPNAMGGREVGGLAHQLAAHMDFTNPADIDRVTRFWQTNTIAQQGGLSAIELFEAVAIGKVKAVWIMGSNPVVSLPDADRVKQALQQCEFVVVSDCIAQTDTTALAHVLLPAQGWSEKEGTVTNSERRISRQRALFKPTGNAKPDWWIISQVAQRMGYENAFSYQSAVEIFREHAALSGFENDIEHGIRDFDISFFAKITEKEYQQFKPVQWPVNVYYPAGKERFFDDQKFFTASGKAQFIAIIPRLPVNLPNNEYPLILNTGRLRDQWHTMTRTALASKLNAHRPEPWLEVHPDDVKNYRLQDQGLAVIDSKWGSMLARVHSTETQKRGHVFIPMHWTAQYASKGRMGALVNPIVDPVSKQPESKHTPVLIKSYLAKWYGFILCRDELELTKLSDYWVKNRGQQFYRYELAGETLPEDWQAWVRTHLAENKNAQWQEYKDDSTGTYRAALFIDNKVIAIVCIASTINLPERQWLSSLLAKDGLSKSERLKLLSGKPAADQDDAGGVICSCFNIGEKTIKAAIQEKGLKSYQEVGMCLKAGTNCGSCVPEIKSLLGV